MKKLLLLIPQNVIPVTDGGKAGIYYPMIMLAKKYEVKAIVFIDKLDVVDKNAYNKLGVDVEFLLIDKRDTVKNIGLNFLTPLPFKFYKYYKQEHQHKINSICKNWQPNIVLCHHAHLAFYCKTFKKDFPTIKVFLREHNIEYLLVQQYYQLQKNPLIKLLAYWQYCKTKKAEEKSWQWFNRVLFISDTDYNYVPKNIQKSIGTVLYDGGKLNLNNSATKKPYFLFTGKVTVLQNQYNVTHFIKNIWIPWKEKFDTKNFEFWITGSSKKEFLENVLIDEAELEKYNIKVLGFVDDLNTIVHEATFIISPTMIGAGIRIKVIEALCMGSVVFLTDIDLKMVKHFNHLQNVIAYKDVNDFNKQFALLIENNMLYKQIQQNAIETAKEYLNLNVMFNKLVATIES